MRIIRIVGLLALCAGTAVFAAEGQKVIGAFEDGVDGWVFNGGGEYAGAKGALEQDQMTSHGGDGSLKLSGDFSGGGKYVGARLKLPQELPVSTVSFWVNTSNIGKILLRLIDSTGQCFQHEIPLQSGEGWKEIKIDNLVSRVKWGGAKDGKWHGGLTEVQVMFEKQQIAEGAAAELYIDDFMVIAPAQ